MNKFICIGHLGSEPEPIEKGCKLSLATEFWNGKEKKTIWLKVFVFGSSGENCLNHLTKGRKIALEGRVDITKAGNMCIITDDVTFL